MQIDRPTIERELAAVRAQAQQAANVLQQATGAEKAFLAMLTILDTEDAEDIAKREADAIRDERVNNHNAMAEALADRANAAEVASPKPRGTSARLNGGKPHAEGATQ